MLYSGMRATAWLLAGIFVGCGGAEMVEPSPFEPEAMVEIATGIDRLVRWSGDDPAVAIEAGPQGGGRYHGTHIFLGVFARDVDPTAVALKWTVRGQDGTELAGAAYRAMLVPVADGFGAWGMRGILSDCCAAENTRLMIELTIIGANEDSIEAKRSVRTGECPGGIPDPTIDPCP